MNFESTTEIVLYLMGGYRSHIQGDPEYQQLQHQLNYELNYGVFKNATY